MALLLRINQPWRPHFGPFFGPEFYCFSTLLWSDPAICYDSSVTTTPTASLLDDVSAALASPGASICVAGRNADNIPSMARALGCWLSEDRRTLTVYLTPRTAAALLDDLRDNGAIAVAVVRPSTHQALQLKGRVARIAPATGSDHARIAAFSDGFANELGSLGYSESLTRALMPPTVDECLAVTFTPAAAFVQTPGRNAGKPLAATR